MEEDRPKSIKGLFHTAERAQQNLSTYPSTNSSDYQDALSSAIATYEECLKAAEQASLFSPNETLDDISSSDLQYMAISYHLAELIQKLTGDISARKHNLLNARDQYDRFLKLLDSYDILSASDAKLYEQYTDDRSNFSVAPKDATARRNAKIARFKEEKELKKKLEYLQQNPRVAEGDEQVVRDLHLTNLAFMVHQTFAQLESLAMELHILSLAPPPQHTSNNPGHSEPTDGREDGRGQRDGSSDRLDSPMSSLRGGGPILSSTGVPLRPFTLLDKRTRLQQGVFRPDHSLPTMTIDEYLEEEKRRGGMIDGGGEQSGVREIVDEDDYEKQDEEMYKARQWDEFKEDNPKGSGNTLNRG